MPMRLKIQYVVAPEVPMVGSTAYCMKSRTEQLLQGQSLGGVMTHRCQQVVLDMQHTSTAGHIHL